MCFTQISPWSTIQSHHGVNDTQLESGMSWLFPSTFNDAMAGIFFRVKFDFTIITRSPSSKAFTRLFCSCSSGKETTQKLLRTWKFSWIPFYLGPKAIPARTMIGVNTLLAMTLQSSSIIRNLPRVSYAKAIDWWMLCCMTFIFASLIELAAIGYKMRNEGRPTVRLREIVLRKKVVKFIYFPKWKLFFVVSGRRTHLWVANDWICFRE